MTNELACAQVGNDLCIGELACQPEAVIVIAEEAQRFVPERTCEMFQYRNALGLIDEYQCSECGADVEGKPNYCPHCGAKVVGE